MDLPNADLAGRKIFIVEDEPVVSMVVEEMALDLGMTLDGAAHTEADAFDTLRGTDPDVAVLDIHLGLVTSLAVAAACHDRGIPVLFITGFTAADIPSACGNDPVLTKPFSPDDFVRALLRCLSPERLSRPRLQ